MTKAILIDPTEMRKPGVLRAPEIPLNQYVADPQAEAAHFGRAALVRIFHDMVVIREFETLGAEVHRGRFGAHMEVASVNDGPITIVIDTHDWD